MSRLVLLSLFLAACGLDTYQGAEDSSAEAQNELNARKHCTAIRFEGSFAPAGNSTAQLSSLFQAQNPIASIRARGSMLTLTSRNGETGTITVTGAVVSGTAVADAKTGLQAFRVMTPRTWGISAEGAYMPLTVTGATLSARFDGFQFLDPIFNGPSWATSITGAGNTLIVSDVFGATGTLSFACVSR